MITARRKNHKKVPSKRREESFPDPGEDGPLTLFILRHGEAGTRMTDTTKDLDRALTANGKAEVREIGKTLKESGLRARQIVTSPLRRARETAEIISRTLKIPVLEEWDDLKPDGDRESLYQKLARIETSSSVVIVGHEPYLTSMIGELIGAPEARIALKKGGLAKVRVTSRAPTLRGELRWLITPKLMTGMS